MEPKAITYKDKEFAVEPTGLNRIRYNVPTPRGAMKLVTVGKMTKGCLVFHLTNSTLNRVLARYRLTNEGTFIELI